MLKDDFGTVSSLVLLSKLVVSIPAYNSKKKVESYANTCL